jgi:hypothetical protein
VCNNRDRSDPALALAIIAGFSAYAAWFLISDSDIWWHLAAGRWMTENKTFLYTDPFSITAFGAAWINVHWLFQLCMYGVFKLWGAAGLVAVKALLFTASLVLFAAARLRRDTAMWTALLAVLAAYALRWLVLDRPLVFSLVFLALFILIIERFRANGNARALWWLVLLQIVWVNSQALFVLGPMVALCYAAGDAFGSLGKQRPWHFLSFEDSGGRARARAYAVLLALLVAACLVNPYGYKVFWLAGRLLVRILPVAGNVFSFQIAENIPPLLAESGTPGIGAWMAVFGLIGLGSFLLTLRSFSWPRFLLFAVFLFLANLAERNAPLYLCILIPVVTGNLNRIFDTFKMGDPSFCAALRNQNDRIGIAVLMIVMAVSVMRIHAERRHDPPNGSLAPFRFPVGATEFLKNNPIAGNLFNSDRQGGYIVWQLFPQERCFLDGRFSLRSRAFLEEFVALLDHPGDVMHYFERYAITHAVVPVDQRQRYLPLAVELYSRGWHLVYIDGADAVFAQDDGFKDRAIDLSSPAEIQKIMGSITATYGDNTYLTGRARYNLDNYIKMLGLENRL